MKGCVGEAVLIDPGSPEHLCGGQWSENMAKEARKAGRPAPTYHKMEQRLEVGGVGAGSQHATHVVKHTLALADGEEEEYLAPSISGAPTPAIYGQKGLRKTRTLLDCYNNRMYRIGPGGYKISLSPGSEVYELEESHAGHLMLPCTRYTTKAANTQYNTQTDTQIGTQATTSQGDSQSSFDAPV